MLMQLVAAPLTTAQICVVDSPAREPGVTRFTCPLLAYRSGAAVPSKVIANPPACVGYCPLESGVSVTASAGPIPEPKTLMIVFGAHDTGFPVHPTPSVEFAAPSTPTSSAGTRQIGRICVKRPHNLRRKTEE